jgi:hypothetical protein
LAPRAAETRAYSFFIESYLSHHHLLLLLLSSPPIQTAATRRAGGSSSRRRRPIQPAAAEVTAPLAVVAEATAALAVVDVATADPVVSGGGDGRAEMATSEPVGSGGGDGRARRRRVAKERASVDDFGKFFVPPPLLSLIALTSHY